MNSIFALVATAELFNALCQNPACRLEIVEQPAIVIHTNSLAHVATTANGWTNVFATVSLLCTNCGQTNLFDTDFLIHRPRATHVVKPPLPKRPVPPAIPMTLTNDPIVHLRVPPGFEVRMVPTTITNN
jgi:hypothetical protein